MIPPYDRSAGRRLGLVLLVAAATIAATPRPAAAEDAIALRRAMADIAAKDWAGATEAARASGPLAEDLLAWHRLRAGRGSLGEYLDFTARHPDWPGMALLTERAESAINAATPAAEIETWFKDRVPLTGNGLRRLITATEARAGRPAAEARLIALWSDAAGALSAADEAALIAEWGTVLERHDGPRVRAALNLGQWQVAQRSLDLVPEAERSLAALRTDLQAGTVNNLADRMALLPNAQQADPGLALDRFRAAVKAKDAATAEAVMAAQSTSAAALVDPALWASRRADYARAALRAGDAARAQRLAAGHFLTPAHPLWTDLEWLAGYAALRAGDRTEAAARFRALAAGSPAAITQSRALYWQARTAEAGGDAATAKTLMQQAAAHQSAFYGQLAAEAAGVPMDPALVAGGATASLPDWRGSALMQDSRMQAAIWLFLAGQPDLAQRFLLQASETAAPEDIGRMTRLMAEFGQTHYALRLAKAAAQKGTVYPAALFPLTGLERDALGIPPELALAIARRESEFNPRAASGAGARGLMQVMPATAREIARDVGLPYDLGQLSTNGDYNALYGATYLRGLQARFGPSIALVAAGYNAGPGRSAQWLKSLGEIRQGADPVDWVEAIPFDETRNYVMRVAEALPVYRARITGAPVKLVPTLDLTGGGVMSLPIPKPVLTLAASATPPAHPRAAERLAAMTLPPDEAEGIAATAGTGIAVGVTAAGAASQTGDTTTPARPLAAPRPQAQLPATTAPFVPVSGAASPALPEAVAATAASASPAFTASAPNAAPGIGTDSGSTRPAIPPPPPS